MANDENQNISSVVRDFNRSDNPTVSDVLRLLRKMAKVSPEISEKRYEALKEKLSDLKGFNDIEAKVKRFAKKPNNTKLAFEISAEVANLYGFGEVLDEKIKAKSKKVTKADDDLVKVKIYVGDKLTVAYIVDQTKKFALVRAKGARGRARKISWDNLQKTSYGYKQVS